MFKKVIKMTKKSSFAKQTFDIQNSGILHNNREEEYYTIK